MNAGPRLSIPGCRDGAGFDPTFPLDEQELRQRVFAAKLSHPGSWAIPLGIGGILSLLPVSTALFPVLLAGLSMVSIKLLWRRLDDAVVHNVTASMINESNRSQNERMIEVTRIFRAYGAGHYADTVVNFLGAKRRCEKKIADDEGEASTAETMENLVDGLCSGVCDELDQLVKLDRKLGSVLLSRDPLLLDQFESDRRDRLETVMEAYSVISETAETLEGNATLAATSGVATFTSEASVGVNKLKRSIADLQYENEIAQRVNERLSSANALRDSVNKAGA